MPGIVPLVVRQNTHVRQAFLVQSEDGSYWDFAGSTFACKVRSSVNSAVVIADLASNLATDPDDTRLLWLDVPAETTNDWPAGEWKWDLIVDGVDVLADSDFVIEGAVSRDD